MRAMGLIQAARGPSASNGEHALFAASGGLAYRSRRDSMLYGMHNQFWRRFRWMSRRFTGAAAEPSSPARLVETGESLARTCAADQPSRSTASSARPSTNRILALKALNYSCGEECAAWAIHQIETGSTNRHILMLAGMSPPFNHFEMAAMRDRALAELGVTSVSREDALRIYAAEIALEAVSGRSDLLMTLRELNRLCVEENYADELHDFYLLYYAWDDLLTSNEQWYWRGATRDNIADIARQALDRFVERARDQGLLSEWRQPRVPTSCSQYPITPELRSLNCARSG